MDHPETRDGAIPIAQVHILFGQAVESQALEGSRWPARLGPHAANPISDDPHPQSVDVVIAPPYVLYIRNTTEGRQNAT